MENNDLKIKTESISSFIRSFIMNIELNLFTKMRIP